MIPQMNNFYFNLDELIRYSLSMIAALTASVFGIKLYQFYTGVRNSYFYSQPHQGRVSLLYISRLTYSTIILSIFYILAELGDIFTSDVDFQRYVYPFLVAAVFIVFAGLCSTAHDLVDKDFKYSAVKKQNKIIKAMVAAAGGYVWYKDHKGRYLFCDPTWCHFFFGLTDHCEIIGMDDLELLDTFRKTKNIRHSFGELCMNTDVHAKERGKQSRYVECGYIGDKLVVLDVLKTPLFEDGEYVGIVGFAWERSDECENIFKDLEIYLAEGKAVVLDEGVYFIKERIVECKWDQPFPGSK